MAQVSMWEIALLIAAFLVCLWLILRPKKDDVPPGEVVHPDDEKWKNHPGVTITGGFPVVKHRRFGEIHPAYRESIEKDPPR